MKNKLISPIAIAAAFTLLALPLAAKETPVPGVQKAVPTKLVPAGLPERVTSVEGITEYRMANGLRVLLFPDQSKPTITVNVTYLVGSRHENYGETGMAHLLEHLLFKGTPKNPAIDKEFNKRSSKGPALIVF